VPEFTTDEDLLFWTVVGLLFAKDAVFVLQLCVFVMYVPFEFLALVKKDDMISELKKRSLFYTFARLMMTEICSSEVVELRPA
jgi:hypothetical protein